jgi:hypothetical protein
LKTISEVPVSFSSTSHFRQALSVKTEFIFKVRGWSIFVDGHFNQRVNMDKLKKDFGWIVLSLNRQCFL